MYQENLDSLVQLTCGNEGMFPGEGDTCTPWLTLVIGGP